MIVNIIIRQLTGYRGNKGSMAEHDIAVSNGDDPWLCNKKGNGWHLEHKEAYTKFLLILER